LTPADRAHLRPQLTRMLRLDQSLTEFHKLHPQARRRRFGRLFRSPTFFEDVVKTITGCNTTWPLTTRMNLLLCQHIGQGAFPTPHQIASHPPAALQSLCKLGYRAQRIHDLATGILEGRHHLADFEDPTTPTDTLHAALLKLPGVGPYAAANLCQLLGRFDRLAIDSETYRHFRQVHHTPTPRSSAALRKLHRRIERHYARYAPYQFIAYWFELWRHYESRVGPARHWTSDHARHFTAASLRTP
ncbi:MAG: endonuclease III domain-containing protein, partial [Phycisphaeraceae bacterium]|nr:endonuclease III domain-containing protein [Phycisphaeraceae bacterium]